MFQSLFTELAPRPVQFVINSGCLFVYLYFFFCHPFDNNKLKCQSLIVCPQLKHMVDAPLLLFIWLSVKNLFDKIKSLKLWSVKNTWNPDLDINSCHWRIAFYTDKLPSQTKPSLDGFHPKDFTAETFHSYNFLKHQATSLFPFVTFSHSSLLSPFQILETDFKTISVPVD